MKIVCVSPRPCSCGPGDSGCTECGVCRTCAGEPHENYKGVPAIVDMANGGLLEVLARSRDAVPLDPLMGESMSALSIRILSLPRFPFVRGEVLPAPFSPPHLIVFSTLLCLLSSSSSLPPLLPSSHLS